MAMETLFICQPYGLGKKGGLKAQPPIPYKTEAQASLRAERMMEGGRIAGVIVIRQSADPEQGDYDEPVFLRRLGNVPGGDA